ncbi:MAG TPA: DUF2330 domain-containing protein [Polyangia bacterium]
MLRRLVVTAAAAFAAAHAADARACGCFAMGSTAQPVVQAGERILFAHEGDQVIAYIQIKYQGAADQFGWIVPLPTVPTLEVGTDELFTMLDQTTLPQYRLMNNVQYCGGGTSSSTDVDGAGGCGFGNASSPGYGGGGASDMGIYASHDMAAGGVVVTQASIGPYDYAVLKADDETAMLQWLSDNRYFVPAGTDAAVMPYIHPGAYFLALKLRGGATTGDIAPIVLRYTSDLPMIPITLTQVGAVDNMGILVWVAGEARAIPRNYYHVVVDDLPVWFGNFSTYNQDLIDAVHEAPGKHGFITQYAGGSQLVWNKLDYPGRFGDPAILRTQATPSDYLRYLRNNSYPFDGTMLSILLRYLPEPQALVDAGVQPSQYYANYDYYASTQPAGDSDGGVAMFDPGPITDDIVAGIVTPMKEVNALLGRHPYLTRLYTALSPKDMTIDPVFSSNRDIGNVSLVHSASLTSPCIGDPWLHTDAEAYEVQYISGLAPNLRIPRALRVELIRDAGPPELVQDNDAAIRAALGPVDHGRATSPASSDSSSSGCGCTVGKKRVRPNLALLLFMCAAAIGVRSLRRRRS